MKPAKKPASKKDTTVPSAERAGRHVPKGTRDGVYRRDRGACVYCRARGALTVDHVRPRADGGSNDESNLVTCCLRCNRLRHRCPMRYWIQWCQDLGFGTTAEVAERVVFAVSTPVPPPPKPKKKEKK